MRHPGKKLLFAGQDFAQPRAWIHDASRDWHLRAEPRHTGVRRLARDLDRLYRTTPALHELDCEAAGFECHGRTGSIEGRLPPLSTLIFEPERWPVGLGG